MPDRANPKNEADFRRTVIAYAHDLGWRIHADPDLKYRIADPGFPDLVLARDIRDVRPYGFHVMFRELKMPGNYLSTDQWKWEQLLKACMLDHSVWRPTDWDRIEEELA